MGRTKKFNREDVLKKVMPIFWSKGYAETGLKELELASGVNKSGLYSEFKDKDEIFIESLRYYYATRVEREILTREPLGFHNIEEFLKAKTLRSATSNYGCFGVNCLRELDQLPGEARDLIVASSSRIRDAIQANVRAEKTKVPPESISEVLCTFFSGMCIEHNLRTDPLILSARIDGLMHAVRMM